MITVLLICIGKYCPRSKYQPSLQGGAMIESNIAVQIEKTVINTFIARICLKVTKKKTKMFKISRYTNRKKLVIRKKRRYFAMASLCNNFTLLGHDVTL